MGGLRRKGVGAFLVPKARENVGSRVTHIRTKEQRATDIDAVTRNRAHGLVARIFA